MQRASQARLCLVQVQSAGIGHIVGVEAKGALAGRQHSIEHHVGIGITGEALLAIRRASLAGEAGEAGVVIPKGVIEARFALAHPSGHIKHPGDITGIASISQGHHIASQTGIMTKLT